MKTRVAILTGLMGCCVILVEPTKAQRVRFPTPQWPSDPYSITPGANVPPVTAQPPGFNPGLIPPGTTVPPLGQAQIPAAPPAGLVAPSATLGGIEPFDPYSMTPPPAVGPPGGPPPVWTTPPGAIQQPPPFYPGQTPGYGPPGGVQPFPSGGSGAPGYPSEPSALFPNGINWGGRGGSQYQRLIQNTGFRYTWLHGSQENQLEMNDIEISTTLVLHPFSVSDYGLRVTPGFIFHFLDGPQPIISSDTNMPPRIYSAYLNSQWDPRITEQFWLELDFRVGVYSDFDTVTNDSVRFTGMGLGAVQMTPNMAFKLGVVYLDRLRIKLLPAGGFVWTPNEQTKFDLIFPRPRISRYWNTTGNSDVWWYVGGEYGGGNWTVVQPIAPFPTDRVDINDIRVFTGLEFQCLYDRVAFFEVGYVFDRELLFDLDPMATNLRLDDTVMIRTGFRF